MPIEEHVTVVREPVRRRGLAGVSNSSDHPVTTNAAVG